MNAFSVTAMNGTSYGTSNSGKPCSSAASRIASGIVGVGEAGAEPEPGQPVAGQPRDVLALRLGPFELQTGGQQQLAAGQPRRRIDDLGDVDPADGVVHARLARDEADLEVAEEVTEGEHRFVTERRESYADSYNLTAAVSRRNHYARAMLAYDRTGSGSPLVLLHGLGSCKEMWRPVMPLLARDHDVIAVDLPGFGESAPGAETVEAQAAAVAALAADLGLERSARGGQLDGRRHRARARRDGPRGLGVRDLAHGFFGNDRERAYARAVLIATRLLSGAVAPVAHALTSSGALRAATFSHITAQPWRLPPEDAALWVRRCADGAGFWPLLRNVPRVARPAARRPDHGRVGLARPAAHLLAPGAASTALDAGGAPRDAGTAAGTCRRGTTLSRSPA